MIQDPHANAEILRAGEALEKANGALILLHGRGATAEGILDLGNYIKRDGFSYLAPQAFNQTWYPYSFLKPIEDNEPFLSSALLCLSRVVQMALDAGIDETKIAIGGFSQGACLALEYAVRNPRRYGAILGLSGGVIGPPGTSWKLAPGALAGTPIFLGCSDVDPLIPLERVHETAQVFTHGGAQVSERIYPGMAHVITEEELAECRVLLEAM